LQHLQSTPEKVSAKSKGQEAVPGRADEIGKFKEGRCSVCSIYQFAKIIEDRKKRREQGAADQRSETSREHRSEPRL
jgi:hypothetical protein